MQTWSARSKITLESLGKRTGNQQQNNNSCFEVKVLYMTAKDRDELYHVSELKNHFYNTSLRIFNTQQCLL